MISESPWLIATKSAGNMTARNLNGQLILQKKRAKGTFTPSPETLGAQAVAAILWTFFRPWAGAIRAGWRSKLSNQEAASAWFGKMYAEAFSGLPSTPSLTVAQLQVARGTITPTEFAAVIDASAGTLVLTWDTPNADETQLQSDIVGVALYNTNNDYLYSQTLGTDTRADGITNLSFLPGTFTAGDVVRVLPFFYGDRLDTNAGKSSNSANLSVTVVA